MTSGAVAPPPPEIVMHIAAAAAVNDGQSAMICDDTSEISARDERSGDGERVNARSQQDVEHFDRAQVGGGIRPADASRETGQSASHAKSAQVDGGHSPGAVCGAQIIKDVQHIDLLILRRLRSNCEQSRVFLARQLERLSSTRDRQACRLPLPAGQPGQPASGSLPVR